MYLTNEEIYEILNGMRHSQLHKLYTEGSPGTRRAEISFDKNEYVCIINFHMNLRIASYDDDTGTWNGFIFFIRTQWENINISEETKNYILRNCSTHRIVWDKEKHDLVENLLYMRNL